MITLGLKKHPNGSKSTKWYGNGLYDGDTSCAGVFEISNTKGTKNYKLKKITTSSMSQTHL